MEEREERFLAQEVMRLELEIECAELMVAVEEETEEIKVNATIAPEDLYTSRLQDGTLCIRYKWKRGWKHIHSRMETSLVRLFLPKNRQFEDVRLKIGAGDANLRESEIHCGSLHIEAGAGNVRAGSLRVCGNAVMEVGAGNIQLGNIWAKKVEVECGMGNFSMNGNVEKMLDVKCSMGKCSIDLEGEEQDYSYSLSCGIGKISVNGTNLGGMAGKHRQSNPGAEKQMDISCGIGNVIVNIA